ncbi:MAG: NAD(P)H-hydrate epimerase [Phycisphaerae bacterium]
MEEPVATRDEIRAFDRYAIEVLGLPGIVLMENAGRQIAEAARAMLAGRAKSRVVILAGPGNNGGDGFVVARHLAIAGIRPEVALLAPREKIVGDADTNLRVLEPLGFQVRVLAGKVEAALSELRPMLAEADLVVDGLLGTGTRGEIREPYASAIGAVNDARRPVLAIDIPSGLDPDTGKPLGPTVRATKTVTLAAVKVGFRKPGAEQYTGEVVLADIGVRFTRFQGDAGKKG